MSKMCKRKGYLSSLTPREHQEGPTTLSKGLTTIASKGLKCESAVPQLYMGGILN